jgi:hypothetical protein
MRLYNHFGYRATLAPLNPSLRTAIGEHLPKRASVEYKSNGIREVHAWP